MERRGIEQRIRAWGAWLALIAIAFNTLLPLAALAKPVTASTIVLCTAHGVQVVSIDPESGLPGESTQSRIGHCPFCSGGGTPLLVDAASRFVLPIIVASAVRPSFAERPLGAQRLYATPTPRGPPASA